MLNKVKNRHALLIYDVNNEYKDFFPHKFNPDFINFTEKMLQIENGVIVYEEATIFLNNRSCNENLVSQLVRKRHTNNFYILVFHSMRAVPRYIYELSNYITIFKTNDNSKLITQKLEDTRIEAIMDSVNGSKKQYYKETLKIN
jgi:hypothetical protein